MALCNPYPSSEFGLESNQKHITNLATIQTQTDFTRGFVSIGCKPIRNKFSKKPGFVSQIPIYVHGKLPQEELWQPWEGTMRPCDLCLLPPGPEDLALSDACAMSGVDPWMEHCSDQRGDGRRWSVSASRWGGAAWELRIPWQAMRWEFLKQSLCKKGAHIRRHYDVLASWCCRTEQMLRKLRVIAS